MNWNFLGPKKLNKTPLGETGCLSSHLLVQTLLVAQESNFLIHFCDLRDTMPRQRSLLPSLTFPTQPVPREAEDFSRGSKYFNHVTLLI